MKFDAILICCEFIKLYIVSKFASNFLAGYSLWVKKTWYTTCGKNLHTTEMICLRYNKVTRFTQVQVFLYKLFKYFSIVLDSCNREIERSCKLDEQSSENLTKNYFYLLDDPEGGAYSYASVGECIHRIGAPKAYFHEP